MNSVLFRAPGRRGGRRPGWTLMTALLILAIAASSALVFTNRVELLKLAVIIALWAAVAAAFVSVIYRRQSDVDQARARDLKLVYDLQLDREISARREYELTVESQLRRELASELRAQAADEVAALRAELAALRTNLEILFDADLSQRPALEPERTPVRAYSDWARSGGESAPGGPTRATSSAATGYPPDSVTETAENPIIDVPEVRIPAAGSTPPQESPQESPQAPSYADGRRGSHRRRADESPRRASEDTAPPPAAGGWAQPPQPFVAAETRREPEPPPPPPSPPWVSSSAPSWKPVGAEGEWLPPGAPGSNWSADAAAESLRRPAPERSEERPSRHGRHAGPADSDSGAQPAGPEGQGRRRARSRHAAESDGDHFRLPPVESPAGAAAGSPEAEPEAATQGRHGHADEPGTGGQSVADLLARLQQGPVEGRRRRRRED
ncbi:DUF6779 domain-containing protein [Mycolicibacter hiberniae]|nr:DUF6779 domain-containing protein [Mycolicibacter hiberniae]MCV7087737.1 hypothetical protein [Mycolicibacter hiberniae]ORV72203.1 hypothetical protein AWC09_04215 [Mycolicibacter hiberniae]